MQPLLKKGRNYIALEMIEFQDNHFGIDLESVMLTLQNKILSGEYHGDKEIRDSIELKKIADLVMARLGLKIRIVTHSALAAVLPFYSNKNHIFITDIWRGNFKLKEQEKILRDAQNKKGTVNLQKARVGGIFSEYENVLYLNFKDLFATFKISAAEAVGVMLHELGHAFEVCEYSDRLETTNQVLANVAVQIKAKPEKKDVVYVYRELQGINKNVTEAEVDKMLNGNKVIAGYLWFKTIIGSVRQQLGNAKYDETSFEQTADSFAIRFGYGRSLITALDKLHTHYGSPEKSKTWLAIHHILATLSFMGLGLGSMAFLFSINIPMGIYLSFYTFIVLLASGEGCKDYTYDELKVRYKRIRNEYIEQLKTMDIERNKLTEILNEVYFIDRIISETHQFRSIFNVVSNFIFTVNKEADSSIKEQQLLEDLSFNDLFIRSAEIQANA